METDGRDDRINRLETAICITEHDIAFLLRQQFKKYREVQAVEDRIIHEQYKTPPEERRLKFPFQVPEINRKDGEFAFARFFEDLLTERRDRLIELFDQILFGSDDDPLDS